MIAFGHFELRFDLRDLLPLDAGDLALAADELVGVQGILEGLFLHHLVAQLEVDVVHLGDVVAAGGKVPHLVHEGTGFVELATGHIELGGHHGRLDGFRAAYAIGEHGGEDLEGVLRLVFRLVMIRDDQASLGFLLGRLAHDFFEHGHPFFSLFGLQIGTAQGHAHIRDAATFGELLHIEFEGLDGLREVLQVEEAGTLGVEDAFERLVVQVLLRLSDLGESFLILGLGEELHRLIHECFRFLSDVQSTASSRSTRGCRRGSRSSGWLTRSGWRGRGCLSHDRDTGGEGGERDAKGKLHAIQTITGAGKLMEREDVTVFLKNGTARLAATPLLSRINAGRKNAHS